MPVHEKLDWIVDCSFADIEVRLKLVGGMLCRCIEKSLPIFASVYMSVLQWGMYRVYMFQAIFLS